LARSQIEVPARLDERRAAVGLGLFADYARTLTATDPPSE
jgi:hypothetical protein